MEPPPPHVAPHSSGILGEGTVSGHPWQVAYEIIPSGSAADVSDEAYCTDTTVDGTTTQAGCTSSKPFSKHGMMFAFMSAGLLGFGSFGEYRFKLGGGQIRYTWTFDWPNR